MLGDLNTENTELSLSRLLEQYAKKMWKWKLSLKTQTGLLVLIYFELIVQKVFKILWHSLQDFLIFTKCILTVLKSSFIKLKAKETYCRDYKNFSSNLFRVDLALNLKHANKDYVSFEDAFTKTRKVIESRYMQCGETKNFSTRQDLLKNMLRKDRYWHNELTRTFW